MIIKKHFGTVERGRFKPDSPEVWSTALVPFEGKRITIAVEPIRKIRSDNENKYYWAVVVKIISDYTGYFPDEVHDAMRLKFLLVPGVNGMPDKMRSTSSLSTVEFEDYLSKIRMWAGADLGLYIPLPNEVVEPI